ncbi:PqqD family protein [Legionella sp. km535]|uniref:PqqD family protein n=1 Tax=Legionella sp. km535 TaxID=2498107 RepID=UPI000F8D4612|nr:PqqD family protein [Legionella sp. km535]RUR17819.1 PqqD family protein [Legionella sp. km535]
MATYRQAGKMTEVEVETNYFPNPEVLKRLIITESGFVFDPLRGKNYRVNSNGLAIIKFIQDGSNLAQIIEKLSEEYHVSREVIEHDIQEFFTNLQQQIK